MAKNQVTLTFAGDSKSLEKAYDRVGSAALDMAGDMDKAAGKAKGLGSAADNVGTAVGNQESKFMGTADVLDGLATTMGFNIDRQIELARGFGDIAGGVENLKGSVSGGIKKLEEWAASLFTSSGASAASATASGAQATAVGASTVATEANTVATKQASIWQRAWNLAMAANPVMLIVTALVVLGTALVVAYKKSETFRRIVNGAFDAVKDAAALALGVIQGIVDAIKKVLTWLGILNDKTTGTKKDVVKNLGDIQDAAAKASRAAGVSVPVDFVGGQQLVKRHSGGIVPGPRGVPTRIMALGGERVSAPGASGASITINVQAWDGRDAGAKVADALREYQRRNGQIYALA